MCIRDSPDFGGGAVVDRRRGVKADAWVPVDVVVVLEELHTCLLYTSDAADERSSVDLGGRRIIKKKNRM